MTTRSKQPEGKGKASICAATACKPGLAFA
jgi:hypothetical protein